MSTPSVKVASLGSTYLVFKGDRVYRFLLQINSWEKLLKVTCLDVGNLKLRSILCSFVLFFMSNVFHLRTIVCPTLKPDYLHSTA